MNFKLWLAGVLMIALPAHAAPRPDIVVEGVQTPAWVEHASGARDALAVGARLANKDRVYTGPGARALLRLADGSLIKLGENAILALDDLGRKKDAVKEVVTATLDVLSGAFRFTTQALYKFRGGRDVKVRLVTITAGVRGTDLWGKADKTRDIVCLIEGSIAVTHDQNEFTMDQPQSFYIVSKNEPQLPVTPVAKEQLELWSAETEIAEGAGALRKGGRWRVELAEAATQSEALAVYDRLRAAGYAAEIRPVERADARVYGVRISNLPSEQEAAVLAARLKGKFGIAQPKVAR
jgi:hypothetical protein